MSTLSKFTDEQLIEAVKESVSITGVLRKLNLNIYGANHKVIKRRIIKLNLDTSHFTGQAWNKGQKITCNPGKPLSEILVENSEISTNHLKQRLIKANLLIYKCCVCGLFKWMKKSIVLQLHHKNGVHNDNRIENLCLICPNCHSQTDTFTSKNAKNMGQPTKKYFCVDCNKELSNGAKRCISCHMDYLRAKQDRTKHEYLCLDCKKPISHHRLRCKSCAGKVSQKPKIVWPSVEKLLKELETKSMLALSHELGISDNAIKKHLKARGYLVSRQGVEKIS